jgi:hypothetical protein
MAFIIALVLLIFVSKELLVFNAETLVLVCFASFVSRVAIRGRDGIVAHFQEREAQIEKDASLQRETLLQYFNAYRTALEYNKDRVGRLAGYLELYYVASEARKAKAQRALSDRVVQHIQEQCKRRVTLETKVFSGRQEKRATIIPAYVESQIRLLGERDFEERLDDAIEDLDEEGDAWEWDAEESWDEQEADDGWYFAEEYDTWYYYPELDTTKNA